MTDIDRKVAEKLTEQGCKDAWLIEPDIHYKDDDGYIRTDGKPRPFSTSWDVAGVLIEHIKDVAFIYLREDLVQAQILHDGHWVEGTGSTKLIALCEAFLKTEVG